MTNRSIKKLRRISKVSGNTQKCKYNIPKSMGYSKISTKENFIAINAYIKKVKRFQINKALKPYQRFLFPSLKKKEVILQTLL